jgi:hypothetical protein
MGRLQSICTGGFTVHRPSVWPVYPATFLRAALPPTATARCETFAEGSMNVTTGETRSQLARGFLWPGVLIARSFH